MDEFVRLELAREPSAARRDDDAMSAVSQNAREIDRAGIRRARVQRRNDDQDGERPRESDDFAALRDSMTMESST